MFMLFGKNLDGLLKSKSQAYLSFPDIGIERVKISSKDVVFDGLQFHLKEKDIPEIVKQIRKKNKYILDESINEAIEFMKSLEDNKDLNMYCKDCIRWLKNGTITLPRDNEKVLESFEYARKHNVDTGKYKSPVEMMFDVARMKNEIGKLVKGKPTDAFNTKGFHFNRSTTVNGFQVDIFDVEDNDVGKNAVSQAIADGSPKNKDGSWALSITSPWCLSTFNYNAKTGVATRTEASNRRWEQYSNGKRQIAFINGYPVAFNSSSRNKDEWWDYHDDPYDTIEQIDTDAPQKMFEKFSKERKISSMIIGNG